MNLQLAQKLRENPEIRRFIAFIQEEVGKLDSLQGLNLTKQDNLAVEVLARLRAKQKLEEILEPLLDTTEISEGFNKEFEVWRIDIVDFFILCYNIQKVAEEVH